MTHNPYTNAYPVGGNPWTKDEDEILMDMMKQGKIYQAIADRLNRTYAAVKARVRYINLAPELKKEIRRLKRANRVVPPKYKKPAELEVPIEVWADRNKRLMARSQMSITALLCGDPEPTRLRA